MTAHHKPTTANEIIREHAEQVVRDSRARCGQISEDGRTVCRFLKGHAGEHGQHMNVTRPEQCANCGKVKAEHTREGAAWYCWPRSDFPTASSMTTGRYLEQFVPPASAPAATPEPVRYSTPACPEHGDACIGAECCCADKHPSAVPTGEEAETRGVIPDDAPLMLAWKAYRKTSEYANSQNWAHYPEHIEGSMWAAFEAGFATQATTLAALRAREDGLSRDATNRVHGLLCKIDGCVADNDPFGAVEDAARFARQAMTIIEREWRPRAALAPRQPTGSQP